MAIFACGTLTVLVLVLGCSDLTEGAGGVVELEIQVPAVTTVEVGEGLQLSARALDRDGSGSVSQSEVQQKRDELFRLLDANGDGVLEPGELKGARRVFRSG